MDAPFPCPNPPSTCDVNSNPVTAFSSEAKDSTTFIGLAWNGTPPPLNKPFNLVPCEAIAESQVSQADADRLARNAAVACGSPCLQTFQNTAQTATGQCSDGSVYSLTIPAGQYSAENQVLADRLAFTAAVAGLRGHSVCLGSLAPVTACRGGFYFGQISAVTTDGPVTMQVSGELPDGLSVTLESDRVVLQGTPTTFGTSMFSVTAKSAVGVVTSKTYQITIVGILTTSPLPDAFFGTAYSTAITFVNPSGLAVAWSVLSGSLPNGLTLNTTTGVISGIPTASGTFHFTIAATAGGATCTQAFTLVTQPINWDSLVWSNILVVPGGGVGGTATGTFSGKNFSVSGKGNGAPSAKVEALGSLTYTGPAVSCKVTVVVTAQGTSTAGFFVNQDGVQRALINTASLTLGTHVFNFSLIAGTNSLIEVKGITDVGDPARLFVFVADTVLWAFSGTFANI